MLTNNPKIGETVRNITGAYPHETKGKTYKITDYDCDGYPQFVRDDGKRTYITPYGYSNYELVEVKPSYPERISLLESQVAELQAKVEALQKPKFDTSFQPFIKKDRSTPNQQRKAVIERAKAFVADAIRDNQSGFVGYEHETKTIKLHVNKEKRAVTALVYRDYDFALIAKAIAKCAPDDVFNADIGKAIALGRALGVDVSEFENAVKPTEVVVGMRVNSLDAYTRDVVNNFVADSVTDEGYPRIKGHAFASIYEITDDTEAQY